MGGTRRRREGEGGKKHVTYCNISMSEGGLNGTPEPSGDVRELKSGTGTEEEEARAGTKRFEAKKALSQQQQQQSVVRRLATVAADSTAGLGAVSSERHKRRTEEKGRGRGGERKTSKRTKTTRLRIPDDGVPESKLAAPALALALALPCVRACVRVFVKAGTYCHQTA
ncbi:hypothetical protein H6P81_012997 [Aristolochia fimbriata]|uniref:Uncharacterized protein n=1 Tax=Aristolochia fimbriata TaxID=158543 RepID=A0AAV7EDS9_ARIFI|nr:hypothetical protein H6P81_012997 [Aristolochia fimbriata]